MDYHWEMVFFPKYESSFFSYYEINIVEILL